MKISIIFFLVFSISKISYSQCFVNAHYDIGCTENCQGAAYPYAGGHQPFEYLWSNGDTTDYADNLCADSTYSVIMTDSLGCTDTAYITMLPELSIEIIGVSQETCSGCCDGTIDFVIAQDTDAPYIFTLNNTPQGNGYFENLCVGSYLICVQDNNACTVCDTVIIDAYTLQQEINSFKSIEIFPNPAGKFITINCGIVGNSNLEIIDLSGNIIINRKINNPIISVNVSTLNKGIYFIRINNRIEKLIIQ